MALNPPLKECIIFKLVLILNTKKLFCLKANVRISRPFFIVFFNHEVFFVFDEYFKQSYSLQYLKFLLPIHKHKYSRKSPKGFIMLKLR